MIAPKAGVAVGGQVFFMDDGAFYVATGSIERIACTVLDHVFGNLNKSQRFKIFAGHNQTHNEVIWFYPSASSNEIDRYVTYNYAEKVWSIGTTSDGFTRTAWNPKTPLLDYPLATGKLDSSDNNYLYNHEFGNTADGTAFNAFILNREILILIQMVSLLCLLAKVIPDIEFLNSNNSSDTVKFSFFER